MKMSVPSLMLSEGQTARLSMNWIVDKRADLFWFIGGALAGYFMFFLHAGLRVDMVTVWFLWVIFLDSPHFFGTYVRTYFDKEEFVKRKKLLIGSLGWLLAGPAMIGLSYLLHQANIGNYKFPFLVFIIFFNLWAYWHVVRQHFGIMSLYKKKNNDFAPADTRIDKAILYVGLLAPFVSFIIRHPEARKALGLSSAFPAYPALNSFSQMFSINFLAQFHWEHVIVFLSIAAFSAVSIAFICRQLYRWKNGLALNIPKIFFMIALIPLYAIINYSAAILTAPLLAFSAFVTIYHDVQYHAIVWFYSKNRYQKPGVDTKKYGLATKITKNFATYMMCGIAMAAMFRLFGCSFQVHPGCGILVMTSDQLLFGSISSKELLYVFLLGLPMHHYFVDQYIWRPSKDTTLQKDLKLNQ
jgi:hypothetical protein